MIIENSIGWCDETSNAVTGCDKVSPGCKNCYAQVGTRARVLRAQGIETWGTNGVRHPVAGFAATIRRLNKLCVCSQCHEAAPFKHRGQECGASISTGTGSCTGGLRHIRLFADSNSDWLDDKWPVELRAEFLKEIHDAPNVYVQLLTKRITNFSSCLESAQDWHFDYGDRNVAGWLSDWRRHGIPPVNVWLGVSVEDQKRADERVPFLLATPAKVRFLSVEPLLEPIKFYDDNTPDEKDPFFNGADCKRAHINWVIVGAESGKNRRDCGLDAILSVVEQCQNAGIATYVKQDCDFKSGQQGRIPSDIFSIKQFPSI